MKKLLSLVLVAVFCFATLGVFVFADGPAATTITASKVEGAIGDEVTVDFTVAGNPGMNGLKIEVGYDASAVAIVETANRKGEMEPAAENGIWVGNFMPSQTASANPFIMLWASADDNMDDGVFGSITFKILDTAVVGVENAITITVKQCIDSYDDDVAIEGVAGYIKVPAVDVTGVTLDKTSIELVEGEEATLTATVAPSNATDKAVRWISSDEDIATVDANGKVTAVAKGEATITAVAGNFTADATVVVTCAHVWEAVVDEEYLVSAANCQNPAVYAVSCEKCGEAGEEIFEYGDVDPDNHVEIIVGAAEATCEEDGYTGDVVCELCEELLEEGSVIPALGHTIVKVEGVAATTEKEGMKEHYKCENCGTLYADKDGKTEVKAEDLVIAKLAAPETPDSPKTADYAVAAAALAALSIGAVVVLRKKKED